ncbi:1-(5-phosphoribosyl)-5-[(5-phosphoribosylamino)methylideneamino]imidazole-4-carboxamide isomerase [Desertibaculum subflavum]|uniref:1-(5-phosphoribosyl)-5-[(5- phosphoribosylamino)methylideneamino]imidazole-4- carboxamide isomerase n=1 Tax=Desertibaculum subflavum TaxID=2268458 RepID=UPI000E66F6B9
MILYPAIDLKEGRCVRLERGEMARATVFNDDPAAQARDFAGAGCAWIHVVDLDGAFAGKPMNAAAVRAIRAAVGLKVQLGGGIRDRATIDGWLEAGVTRVVLGTAAVRDPALVKEAARAHPGRVAVGIDAKGGKVAVQGWAETTELTTAELGKRFEDAGVAALIHTDVDRDGLLQGVNVEATAALARAVRLPVIASGGVASLDDLVQLKAVASAGIEGVIVGRAIYDGRVDPAAALKLLAA